VLHLYFLNGKLGKLTAANRVRRVEVARERERERDVLPLKTRLNNDYIYLDRLAHLFSVQFNSIKFNQFQFGLTLRLIFYELCECGLLPELPLS